MSLIKLKRQTVLMSLFFVVIFIVTRQVPFSNYSFIGNIALVFLCLIGMPIDIKVLKFFSVCCVWVSLMATFSAINGNDIGYIIRFSIMVLVLLAAYFIRLQEKSLKILFYLCSFQCILLIMTECILVHFYNIDSYFFIRDYVRLRNWGDIYTYNGYFYRIQVKGNALIPFVYILSYIVDIFPVKTKRLWQVIYLIAIICAGNFAYLISLVFFHIVFYFVQKQSYQKFILKCIMAVILSVVIVPVLYNYTVSVISNKEDSLDTRSDQVEVLLDDMDSSVGSVLFGKGLGHTISKSTLFRDYTGEIYYEIQPLYFFNQMGLVNFFIFVFVHACLALIYIRSKSLLFVYCCYIIYAVTNPYIFDMNHFIVILSLVMANKKYEDSLYISSV